MSVVSMKRWWHIRSIALTLITICMAFSGFQSAQAQSDDRPTSLEIVPASAAFYMASMNHAAQYEAIVKSNAYKQLMDCDVAKRMRKAYRSGRRNGFRQFGRNNPFAEYLDAYSQSVGSVPGKMVMNYLSDIFGNELFLYGDNDWLEMSRGISKFYKEAGVLMEDVNLNEMDEDTISQLLKLGRENLQGINTPKLVMGTVLDSPGGTKSLLQMAELGIDELLTQIPEDMEYAIEGYEVIEEGDLYLLSFQLDSDSLPWAELERDRDFEPFVDDIKAILSDKSVNISVGVKGKFLLFSIGPDNKHIRNLGEGDLLINHEKLAPLKAAAKDHPMTGVRYQSDELARFNHENIPGLIDTALSIARFAYTNAPSEAQEDLDGLLEDLKSDAEELKGEMMANIPKPGAYLGFSYMIDNGFEGYVYNWAENKYMDSSKPLTLMANMGERPAMFAVSRDLGDQGQYDFARKWTGRLYDRVVKYVPRTAPSERDAELFVDIATEVKEFISELADSTQSNLLEATRGGQVGMVIDFTTARKSWHDEMPPSDFDLPIPSMSIMMEHNDKEKMIATGSSVLKTAVDISDMIRDLPNSDVPDEFQIPDPQSKSAFDGDLFYYELPIQAGMDPSLMPHALVRDDLVVLGYSLDQTERLMQGKTPRINGLLADHSRNLMAASYYNNREVIGALETWLRYGIDVARESGETMELGRDAEKDTLAFTEDEVIDAADHVIALLKCLESASSMSYMEDDVQVTRYQMLFEDVSDK